MSSAPGDSNELEELAARVADGDEPDWSKALKESEGGVDPKVIDSLKLIGELARANRRGASSPTPGRSHALSFRDGADVDAGRAASSSSSLSPADDPSPSDEEGPTLRPGQRLGPYEIMARIGVGGMGEVYRAQQTQLGRDVAIKTLPWRAQISLDARRRFEREAQLSASLHHRNVVAVHDFCTFDGIAFVVEEHLTGATWRGIVSEAAGTPPVAGARMIAEAAQGVAAAHAVGLIHRDLKPENLFETKQGETKVLDFGLARLLEPTLGSPSGGGQPSSGVGLGTAAYLAPECLRGAPADRRSDVFALACSAYELLTGRNPFRRANTGDTIVALLKESPQPLREALSGVPGDLADTVERGLSKNPADRPAAEEIARVAREAAASGARFSRPMPPARPRGGGVFVAAVIVVVLAGLGTLGWWRSRALPVAVLLFDSSAIDKDLAYVAVALSEHLNQQLSKTKGLEVRSRLVIGQGVSRDPRSSGHTLGARSIVAGQLKGTPAALSAELRVIDVASGRTEWAHRFEGSTSALADFGTRIATGVLGALGKVPGEVPPGTAATSASAEVRRLYAEGRYYWFRRSPKDLYRAINLFTEALALEPDFALGHAGLSRAYVDLAYYVHDVSSKETVGVARRAAERALALEPNLVRGITALADVEGAAWNRQEAQRLYRKAMQLDPTDADAHLGEAADVLLPQGRFQEAREVLRRGLGLEASSLVRESLGRISYYERDFPRAHREFSEVLETEPGFVSARYRLGQTLLASGKPDEALVALREADRQTAGLAKGRAIIVFALAASGRRSEAQALLDDLLKERDKTYVSATLIGAAYTGLGDYDRALEWLEQGCAEHAEWMHLIGVEPLLDPLRKNPRFDRILECVGLKNP